MLSTIPSKLSCRPSRPPSVCPMWWWCDGFARSCCRAMQRNVPCCSAALYLQLGFNEAGAIQQPVHRAILTCSGTPSHVGAPNQPQNYLKMHAPWWKWLATCDSPMVALPGHRQGWPSPLMCWETLWECNTATIRHQPEHEFFFEGYTVGIFHYPITPVRFEREKLRSQQVAWNSMD